VSYLVSLLDSSCFWALVIRKDSRSSSLGARVYARGRFFLVSFLMSVLLLVHDWPWGLLLLLMAENLAVGFLGDITI
jgi:hypothetical protein